MVGSTAASGAIFLGMQGVAKKLFEENPSAYLRAENQVLQDQLRKLQLDYRHEKGQSSLAADILVKAVHTGKVPTKVVNALSDQSSNSEHSGGYEAEGTSSQTNEEETATDPTPDNYGDDQDVDTDSGNESDGSADVPPNRQSGWSTTPRTDEPFSVWNLPTKSPPKKTNQRSLPEQGRSSIGSSGVGMDWDLDKQGPGVSGSRIVRQNPHVPGTRMSSTVPREPFSKWMGLPSHAVWSTLDQERPRHPNTSPVTREDLPVQERVRTSYGIVPQQEREELLMQSVHPDGNLDWGVFEKKLQEAALRRHLAAGHGDRNAEQQSERSAKLSADISRVLELLRVNEQRQLQLAQEKKVNWRPLPRITPPTPLEGTTEEVTEQMPTTPNPEPVTQSTEQPMGKWKKMPPLDVTPTTPAPLIQKHETTTLEMLGIFGAILGVLGVFLMASCLIHKKCCQVKKTVEQDLQFSDTPIYRPQPIRLRTYKNNEATPQLEWDHFPHTVKT